MNDAFDRGLRDELDRIEGLGLRRDTVLDGRGDEVDFGSNDYLDLAGDPEIIAAMSAAAHEFGAGARAARLLRGGSPLHEQAEQALAEWLGCEAALLFPSGYQANVGLLTALLAADDVVISDRDNHASLIDAMRLSRARVFVHEHCDLEDLERALEAAAHARRRVVVTEGVFSMKGDAAPLLQIDELCRRHDAWLVVDQAHSVGLLGPQGAGAWAGSGVRGDHRMIARVVTGGKALGVAGAFVAGSAALRAVLIHRARSFMFTTAPPPALAGGLLAAIARCRGADVARRDVLNRAREFAERLGLPRPAAAIVPYPVGAAESAVALAGQLREAGIYAPAVRPPTVADGDSRLRIVCHAGQTDAQLAKLIDELSNSNVVGSAEPTHRDSPRARATFVVGTDTGVGKTVVSALLLRAAQRLGHAVYWKPVQTGDDDDTVTVARLSGAASDTLLPNFAAYPLPASPHEAAADVGDVIDPRGIAARLREHELRHAGRDLLIEFAGGLHVPYSLDPGGLQIDMLERGRRVVLVARSGLGTLNHTLLSLEALRARGITPLALFLVGEVHPSNFATLRRLGRCRYVFQLPQFMSVDTAALDGWLQQNGLEELFADE